MSEENHLIKERISKLNEIRELGVNPYPYTFEKKNNAKELLGKYSNLKAEEKTKDKVSVAGRIMQLRKMGKASFVHIQDETEKIQIYFRQDDIGVDSYKLFKKLDIGDIIGVNGTIFKTRMGEVTVYASKLDLLTKSIRPLPEKYHGLKDTEIRFRKRYLDLIMNHDVKDNFIKRTMIIDEIRSFYKEKGYLEVDVPALQTQYGGANAKPFVTHIHAWNMEMFLSISPELYLKRLLVGGFEKVFTICKNFRNEGVDKTHNPEFTMMESYGAYIDYNTLMDMTEELFLRVAKKVNGNTKARYNDNDIDIKGPWKRIPMIKAIKDIGGVDVEKMSDSELKKFINEKNIVLNGSFERGWAILGIFEELVEEKLIQPTFITDYPKITSPLCKIHRNNPDLIERFEFFIGGKEFGNAYSELNDPIIQKKVLEAQSNEIRAGFEEAHPMDEDFVEAIETGMPPAGGLGIGVDRMVMLFTNSDSLRDVIFFPTMKPQHVEEEKTGKSKDTMIAVALINKGLNLEPWKEMNTVAHLNAAFAARIGKKLIYQDNIETKDDAKIKLNIQHAIMIKEVKDSKEIIKIIKEAKESDLDISEFTDEMIKTTDDVKVMELTKNKNLKEIDYLGVLIFGKKKVVEKITKKFKLYN